MHHSIYIFKVKLNSAYFRSLKSSSNICGFATTPTMMSINITTISALKIVAIIPQILPALAFLYEDSVYKLGLS